MPAVHRSLLRQYLYVLALCCAIAVLTTLMWPHHGFAGHLAYALCIGTLCWTSIAVGRALTPPRHRHPAHDGGLGWPRGWRGVALTGASIAVGFYGGDWLAGLLLGSSSPGRHSDARDSAVGLYITMAAAVLASYYFHSRSQASALAARIARAERDASEARLKLLEAQLEPHMLFNTLANLRALIALDPPRATRMLDHLVAFLRATLQASRATEHGLAQEFARLRDYLELMSERMGPRLRYRLELPAPLASRPVPALLLQPLVENAVLHGLEPRIDGGMVQVKAWEEPGRLCLQVEDDGLGLGATSAGGPGSRFGLEQVRERLAARYGEHARLSLAANPQGGTVVRVCLPAPGLAAVSGNPAQQHGQQNYIQDQGDSSMYAAMQTMCPTGFRANKSRKSRCCNWQGDTVTLPT